MMYPRWLTVMGFLTVIGLAFSLYMELPTLSKAAQEGLRFGILLDGLIVMLTISLMGLRLWKHQVAIDAAAIREKNDIGELAGYRRYILMIISLSLYAALPILTAILFSVGT